MDRGAWLGYSPWFGKESGHDQATSLSSFLSFFTPWKKSYDKAKQCIKKQRHYFVYKGPSSQSYGFSSSHVWMCKLNYKELMKVKAKELMLLNYGVGEYS